MRWLVGVALTFAVWVPALARGKQTLEISLGFARELYLSGEDVSLRISLRNTGPRPIRVPTPFDNRNWQPKYVLRGPKGTRTFSARDVALPNAVRNPPLSEAVLVDLAPGEKLEGEIPLHHFADLRAAGKYAVAVRLRWEVLDAASKELAFRVEPARIRGAALVADLRGPRLLWLHAGGSAALMEQLFVPTVEGLRVHFVQRVAAASAAATAPFGSPMGAGVPEPGHYWRGFREPGALVAFGPKGTVARIPVADGALVAQNAFGRRDGGVEVAVADGRTLSLLGASGASWTMELPHAASAIAATGRPDGKGGRRIAVLAAVQDDLELSLFDTAAQQHRAPTRAQGAAILAGSRLALYIAEDGSSEAATLVTRGGKVALLRARFDPRALADEVSVDDLAGLDASPAASAVAFRPSGEVAWAALLPSGAIASSVSTSVARVSGMVLVPMQVHATQEKLYVLVQPAGTAPTLHPL
jgi:hypothetical protein